MPPGVWTPRVYARGAYSLRPGALRHMQVRHMPMHTHQRSNSNENNPRWHRSQKMRGEVDARAWRVCGHTREEVWASAVVQGAWVSRRVLRSRLRRGFGCAVSFLWWCAQSPPRELCMAPHDSGLCWKHFTMCLEGLWSRRNVLACILHVPSNSNSNSNSN